MPDDKARGEMDEEAGIGKESELGKDAEGEEGVVTGGASTEKDEDAKAADTKAAEAKVPEAKPAAAAAAVGEDDPEELKAELAKVRKEKEDLAARLAETPEEKAKRRAAFWRTFVAVVLIVLGCLLAALAVPAIWLDRTVTDQATWVDTVGPLAQDPAIQSFVADRATSALFEQFDVQKLAESALPPKLQPFAPAIAGAVHSFVNDQAHAFTQSAQFYNAWIETNKIGQKALVTVATPGQAGAVSSANGKVTLDIGLLVDNIKTKLVASGLGIIQNVPTSAVQGRQIVLFESPYLAYLQQAFFFMGLAAVVLPLAAVLVLAAAVALAVDRRKAVLWTGIGLVLAMLLPLGSIYLGQYVAISQLVAAGAKMPPDVANILFTTLLRYLVLAQQFVMVIGLIMVVAAAVAGPATWAVGLRGGVNRGLSGLGAGWDFGPFGEWVLANKPLLRGLGLVLGILALIFIPGAKFALLVWIVVLEIVWLLLIEFFGRARPGKAEAGGGPEGPDAAAA